MKEDKGFEKLGDLMDNKKPAVRPPAHEWQELALRVINELGVPSFKRGAVFKIAKDYPKNKVEKALNDTKELCQTGEKYKYFFKIIGNE